MPFENGNPIANIDNLRQLCIAIGKIQQSLALDNIWIRGAISCGETFFDSDNSQIVGQAYIDAYLLESEVAIYPRVILDSTIIMKLGFKDSQTMIWNINSQGERDIQNTWCSKILFTWQEGNVSAKTSIPHDVPLFINYLYPLIEKNENTKILKLINNIRENMYSNLRIYNKYRWVVNYLREIASVYHEGSEMDGDAYQQLVVL